MVHLLFPLIILLGIVALAFVTAGAWGDVRQRVLVRLSVFVILVSVISFAARYWIIIAVDCVPNCVGVNLVARDMSGMRLENANFVGANLTGAQFGKARLQQADFSGARLSQANFEGADLTGARLLGANLHNANLAGADLRDVNLNGADLTGADLTGVDLTQTSLFGVSFDGAEMEDVDLTGASLAAVSFVDAQLNGAQLVNADLSGATMSRADLSGAQLNDSNLSGAWLNLATLIGAGFVNADLSGASLIGADLASADFNGGRLVSATLVGANMNGTNLNGANLLGARLRADELTEADLQLDTAVLELNELQRSEIIVDARWDGATFNSQTVWPSPDVGEEVAAVLDLTTESQQVLTDTIKVGVLHSLSGPMAISEVALRDATFLAIDEINAAGGVLGRQLEPITEDGASSPAVFAEKAQQMLESDEVAVIFGGWTSDSRKAMLPVLEKTDGLLFYPVPYEGFEQSPQVFYLGQEPSQQLIPAVNFLLEQGLTSMLLIGSEFAYSRVAHTIIKVQLNQAGYNVVGELFVPLGGTDFGAFIQQLRASPPDVIVNTMYGESNVAFFQQLAEAGITAQDVPVLSTSVAEEEVRVIGPEYVRDHYTTLNYFQTLATPENFTFVTAYKNAYGNERVTSAPIAAAYSGVYVWKALVETAGDTSTDAVRAAAATPVDYVAPEGPVTIDAATQHTYKYARIGIVREDGLIEEVISSAEPLPPDPFLSAYPWSDIVQDVLRALEPEGQAD